MYQRWAASIRVPANNLHLRESAAMNTAIRVLKEVMCSTVSPLPSKADSDGDLEPSWTGAFQNSADSGWGSGSSNSS